MVPDRNADDLVGVDERRTTCPGPLRRRLVRKLRAAQISGARQGGLMLWSVKQRLGLL
jgi:hypothetical protein